jgi:hypothetical protein
MTFRICATTSDTTRALDVSRYAGTQTRQCTFTRIKFGIETREGIVDIAVEGA